MSFVHFVLVGIGGAIGAMARHGVGMACKTAGITGFPWATLTVNVAGSFLMGLLVAWLAKRGGPGQENLRLLLAVGVLGGFTTFSSFSLDFITLIERGQPTAALIYASASVVASIIAISLGLAAVRALG